MQQYLQPSVLDNVQVTLLFQLKSRLVEVKVNYKNKYRDLQCPVCKVDGEEDSQQHILTCNKLLQESNIIADKNIIYSHIFHNKIEKQAADVRLILDAE